MSRARELIQAELTRLLPDGYQVHPYAKQLDNVEGPTILVQLDRITPATRAGRHARTYGAKLLAVADVADVDLATTLEVDQLAEDLVFAVELSSKLTWSSAERVTVDDTWAGWAVETTILTVPDTITTP